VTEFGIAIVGFAAVLLVLCLIALIRPFAFQPLNSRKNAIIGAVGTTVGSFLLLCLVALSDISSHPEKYQTENTPDKPVETVESTLQKIDPRVIKVEFDETLIFNTVSVKLDTSDGNKQFNQIVDITHKALLSAKVDRDLGFDFFDPAGNLMFYASYRPETIAYIRLQKLNPRESFDRTSVFGYSEVGRRKMLDWCSHKRKGIEDVCAKAFVTPGSEPYKPSDAQ
jgi:hypothetical protein